MEDGKVMIKILYEDNHLLVVEKPANVLVQADSTKDLDLLTILKDDLKKRYNKPGNVYLGLIHRLDRPVGGVMVFAKTSKAAARLSLQVQTHKLEKQYFAVVEGVPNPLEGTMVDYLKKNEKLNKVFVDSSGKKSVLDYKVIETVQGLSLVKIDLKTGRSHQIRVQFASRKYPLYGDQKYNIHSTGKEQIALYAYQLSFEHPITKERMIFNGKIPKSYPWNLYNRKSK